MDFLYQFNLKLIAPLFTFLFEKIFFYYFQKLTGLWLVGVVVNHVGIYGSKVAEGLSAFQRRSCSFFLNDTVRVMYQQIIFGISWNLPLIISTRDCMTTNSLSFQIRRTFGAIQLMEHSCCNRRLLLKKITISEILIVAKSIHRAVSSRKFSWRFEVDGVSAKIIISLLTLISASAARLPSNRSYFWAIGQFWTHNS